MGNNKRNFVLILILSSLLFYTSKINAQQLIPRGVNPEVDGDASMVLYVNTTGDCSGEAGPTLPFGLQVKYTTDYFPTFESGVAASVVRGAQTFTENAQNGFDRVSQYYVLPYKIRSEYGVTPSSNTSFLMA